MSKFILTKTAPPTSPTTGKVLTYIATDSGMRTIDETGLNLPVSTRYNSNTISQSPAAATLEYLVGSALTIPPTLLRAGARFRWKLNVSKTAAGTASSTYDIRLGTTGTTADTNILSFVKPAGTAASDEGFIVIEALVQTTGTSATIVAEFTMIHNLQTTGHATIPCVVVKATTAGGSVDTTVSGLIIGLTVTSGAADALTFDMVYGEMINC